MKNLTLICSLFVLVLFGCQKNVELLEEELVLAKTSSLFIFQDGVLVSPEEKSKVASARDFNVYCLYKITSIEGNTEGSISISPEVGDVICAECLAPCVSKLNATFEMKFPLPWISENPDEGELLPFGDAILYISAERISESCALCE